LDDVLPFLGLDLVGLDTVHCEQLARGR